jgi:competence protein ComFC
LVQMPFATLKDFLFRLKDDILDFVYPQSCPICQKSLKKDENLICEECLKTLAILPAPFCPYCRSFFEEGEPIVHHNCIGLNHPEDRKILAVRSLGRFDDSLQKLIHQFKYGKKIPLGKHLAESLGQAVAKSETFTECDLVIPVPLHSARHRERGFNQSQVLAEGISEVINIPVLKGVLKRKKNTKDQTYLNAEQRAENVKNAFVIAKPEMISSKKIILVDDVMTTGATLNECAGMLHSAGAKSVLAATLANVVD